MIRNGLKYHDRSGYSSARGQVVVDAPSMSLPSALLKNLESFSVAFSRTNNRPHSIFPAHTYVDIVMLVFITINLGKCGAGSVRRRSWLGLAGVVIIVLAGVAAYGLNSGFGKLHALARGRRTCLTN